MSDEANSISADQEILRQVAAGMVPQATVRIQIRQMKALERIADELSKIEGYLWRPDPEPAAEPVYKESEPHTPTGPATELDDAGTPRVRRRRSSEAI
jgi:hypothetical protein